MGIAISRDRLRAFAEECEAIVGDLNTHRAPLLSSYAGTTDDYTPVKWRNGVKVTLGTVDHAHPGREAGELLADRIGAAGDCLLSAEEGMRALAVIAREALSEFEGQDSISAEDLARIVSSHSGLGDPALGGGAS